MSNLFEEFSFDEPVYLDTSLCETEAQQRLREYYSSLTSRNEIELAQFDPTEPSAFRSLKLASPNNALEAEDEQIATFLRQQMLHSLGLDITRIKSADVIADRVYQKGRGPLYLQ